MLDLDFDAGHRAGEMLLQMLGFSLRPLLAIHRTVLVFRFDAETSWRRPVGDLKRDRDDEQKGVHANSAAGGLDF
jgi:hypothetical protein